ncbi:MAG: hypothetical protein IEMM0003_0471 [bacterium]|nr:MAG: hypothetical protein IEMM0003_0471 [bacterium]
MYRLIFPESYLKIEREFLKIHYNLISPYKKVIELAEIDIRHPSLRLHKLNGRLKDYHSVSINLIYRIIIRIDDNSIIFVHIGHHDKVYRN